MEDIILIGYGGHAKSIIDSIEMAKQYNIVGYTDVKETTSKYTYLGNDSVLKNCFEKGIKNAVVCIGYLGKGNIRQKIYSNLKEIGFSLPVIIDPTAIISKDVIIEEGTFVGKNAVINADAKIGKMCIINTAAIVEHECNVEEFSHIAVGTVLCGQVKVGRAALVGANATVIQCRQIGENQIVPAGAVIRN